MLEDRLDNMDVVVDTELLGVSLSNKPCLVFDSIPFPVPLDVVDPHGVHDVRTRGWFDLVLESPVN